jgi:4-carboxymuconolactone decarboxylase
MISMQHSDNKRTGPDGDAGRYSRGLSLMDRLVGDQAGADIRSSLNEICPDYARYMVEAGFADIYGRPGLTLQQRQMINLAALTALGGCEPQLETHLEAGLNVGLSPEEIVEMIFHLSLYVGHPRVNNAFRVARPVFARRGISPT